MAATDFVLDNSVTMRWCFDAGTHAYADQVLDQLQTRQAVAIVPVLWRYELSAVLARAETKAGFPALKTREFLQRMAALDIRIDGESAGRVLTDVHQLAVHHRLTSYDAAYLEVAQRRSLPLATLDDELRAACQKSGIALV
jgi:predicted nucleic acid-binding protein